MAKEIIIEWQKPIELFDSTEKILDIDEKDMSKITEDMGVYVFARRHSGMYSPLYIGCGSAKGAYYNGVRGRIKWHIKHSTELMLAIKRKKMGTGAPTLIVGEIKPQRGDNPEFVEKELIRRAMADGYNLLNVQHTKIKYHSIQLTGYPGRRKLNPFGTNIQVPPTPKKAAKKKKKRSK